MRKQPSESYRGFREPGIRLSEPVLPNLVAHRSDQGRAILYAVHAFDKAHLVMLAEGDLIPRDAALAMLRTLRETESAEGGFMKARGKAGGGMHSAEYLLIQRLGEEVGGHIHLGRSSGDLGEVAARIFQRDGLLEILAELGALRAAVLSTAAEHTETLMPGYLQGQHAQPVTLGHQLAGWAAALERDFARALEAYGRINQSAAGAAIMTGSGFAVDRRRTSELLGFERPLPNTHDAVLAHDALLDSFSVLAILGANLARWADDLLLWDMPELGFVEIPDRFCGTSSILMQTKSPYAPELMKGAAAAAAGGLVTALAVEKGPTGLPLLDRHYSYDALFRVQGDTLRNLRWWKELLPALRFDIARMAELAGAHWGQATDLAGALVRERGLPWRTAHQIVGILVRYAEERGFAPAETTTELLDEAAIEYHGSPAGLGEEALREALDPRRFVESRELHGGPAPSEVRRQLDDMRAALERQEAARAAAQQRVDASGAALEAAIDALLGADGRGPAVDSQKRTGLGSSGGPTGPGTREDDDVS